MAVVVALDQATKWFALRGLDDGPIALFWGIDLRLVFNTGSAFGVGADLSPFIAVASVVVVVVLLRTGRGLAGWPANLGIALVVGGAIGNLIDRVARAGDGVLGGAVVDFVDLGWWPVFNLADAAITVGAPLLVLALARESEPA